MTKTTSTALAAVLLLAACAGRAPQQIAVVQPKDVAMDCTALNAEIAGDATHEADLAKEEGNKRGQNIAAGIGGAILFWPALFLMDFQDAAGTERKALESRDQYLATLAAQRCAAQPLIASSGGVPVAVAAGDPQALIGPSRVYK
jgi:hypothetical protein